ncbi:hypothetical protein Vafri_20211, partial [Volvox africanus]
MIVSVCLGMGKDGGHFPHSVSTEGKTCRAMTCVHCLLNSKSAVHTSLLSTLDFKDVTLLGAPISGDGRTLAVVTRPLKTCDPWDWPIMDVDDVGKGHVDDGDEESHVASDGSDVGGGSGGRHMPTVAAASEPVTELDVLMPNITIPDNQTTSYLCVYVTLPHD